MKIEQTTGMHSAPCLECDGDGWHASGATCTACDATGWILFRYPTDPVGIPCEACEECDGDGWEYIAGTGNRERRSCDACDGVGVQIACYPELLQWLAMPVADDVMRRAVLAWCGAMDPNGDFSDASHARQGIPPATLGEALWTALCILPCETCDGSGVVCLRDAHRDDCRECNGTGTADGGRFAGGGAV